MTKVEKISESKLIKHCMSGKPTKYNKDIHIPLLIKCFIKGHSVRQFCARALITERTFYNWLNDHREFKNCYDVALNFAADFWESLPFKNPEFNYPYLQAVLRNRFGFGKSKLKLKDKKSPVEIVDAIQEGLSDQTINIQDIKTLIELIQIKHQLLTNLDLEQQEAKRYTPEQWLEMSDKILDAANILELQLKNKKLKRKFEDFGDDGDEQN